MRIMTLIILMVSLLAFAGCDATGAAQGGGTDNAGYGRVKIGVPF